MASRQCPRPGPTVISQPRSCDAGAGLVTLSWDVRDTPAVLTATGELDLATAPHLRAAVLQLADGASPHLVLDLTAVTFIDCFGIGMLVASQRDLGPERSLTLVCDPAGLCWRLLGLTGVAEVLPPYPSMSEALAAQAHRFAEVSGKRTDP